MFDPDLRFERSTSEHYETNKIKSLQDDRNQVQEETFVKWINAHLGTGEEKVSDLFSDLSDGKILHKLLESLSGKKVGKINAAKIKLQKIENVEKCLKFMSKEGLHLENIGALDVVEGKQNLILGLLWSIIQHYEMGNTSNRNINLPVKAKPSLEDIQNKLRIMENKHDSHDDIHEENKDEHNTEGVSNVEEELNSEKHNKEEQHSKREEYKNEEYRNNEDQLINKEQHNTEEQNNIEEQHIKEEQHNSDEHRNSDSSDKDKQLKQQDILVTAKQSYSEATTAESSLLVWAQKTTNFYTKVKIINFSESWRDGWAFNALIHAYKPSAFNFRMLDSFSQKARLEHAFELAEKEFGVACLLDAEDFEHNVEEKRIIAYLSVLCLALEGSDSKTNGEKLEL